MLLRYLMIRIDIRGGHSSRRAVVHRCKLRAILGCEVLVLQLVCRGLKMLLVGRPCLDGSGTNADAAATVIADVVDVDDGVALNDGAIFVDVGYVDAAEISRGTVVGKDSAAPFAAEEAYAAVAESIVNTAVEADVRAPVSGVPCIGSTHKSPVAGGPQNAHSWGLHPDSGHPVVAGVAIGPVAGCPHIARGRQRRLHIDR